MRLSICEHRRELLIRLASEHEPCNKEEFKAYEAVKPRTFVNKRKTEVPYYKIHLSEKEIHVEADYYIGVDWLISGKKYVHVLPKVNARFSRRLEADIAAEDDLQEIGSEAIPQDTEFQELNFLGMLHEITGNDDILPYLENILYIDWDSPEIQIDQKDDLLTPFLIVQFLHQLKHIVRKGLRKSYYVVRKNLQNRIKGKILVSQTIKTNLIRNKRTHICCEYQEYGIDHIENRFLKKVLDFVIRFIADNPALFRGTEKNLFQTIGYCSAAFESVSDEVDEQELAYVKKNVFFREYNEAIRTGQYILKRFGYNISNASKVQISTPPFWINMPELFELYVYKFLLDKFPRHHLKYHFSTYGNELDFLITAPGFEMVVDAKYKLHYQKGANQNDMRQVAGYARLNKVYREFGLQDNKLIDCLIIYPDVSNGVRNLTGINDFTIDDYKVGTYRNIFKIGIQLPLQNT